MQKMAENVEKLADCDILSGQHESRGGSIAPAKISAARHANLTSLPALDL
jgi:hypothetical protein